MKIIAYILLTLIQSDLFLTLYVPQEYVIPNPTFEVFSPRGFEVSIPDENGIELFAFHANINRPMYGLEAGQISKDVLKKENGYWVFEDKKTKLREGDVVHYWLFVIKEKLGYRYDDGEFVVRDIIEKSSHNQPQTASGRPIVQIHSDKNSGLQNCNPICELAVNLSTSVDQLTEDVKGCKETNEVLKDLVAKDDISLRTLKFGGTLPPYDDAHYTAQIILQEKLGLNIPVVNATMENDRSITFQVFSLDDKVLIIKAAKEKLEKMRSKIILKY